MSLGTTNIVDAVVTHALTSGLFSQVNAHEPKNPPSTGLACAVWADRVGGIRRSGLDSMSARLALTVRVFKPLVAEPADDVDAVVLGAVDTLFTAYCGDFTLGGLIRHVDILGAEGPQLDAALGYFTVDDVDYRVATITLPLIINDLWTEVA